MTGAQYTLVLEDECMCVLKDSSPPYLQADSRVLIETGCYRQGFLWLLTEVTIWWIQALYIGICLFILFFYTGYGRQAPLMLHWHCKYPEVHFGRHRDPAAAQRGHIVFLLLCCPRENPDVAPDCRPECPTAPSKTCNACPPSPLAWETEFLLWASLHSPANCGTWHGQDVSCCLTQSFTRKPVESDENLSLVAPSTRLLTGQHLDQVFDPVPRQPKGRHREERQEQINSVETHTSIQISSDLTHFALLNRFLGAYKTRDILAFKGWLCMLGQWAMDVMIKVEAGPRLFLWKLLSATWSQKILTSWIQKSANFWFSALLT